jgi:uncharacterized protein YyaL (SSP411 family)
MSESSPESGSAPRETRSSRHRNALAGERSPYLLQHAGNPVPWRPWTDAAIAEARRRGVPLLVSVGYSTCYWCHVMERECFEDEAIARQMGEDFVCVKVDREQRPDLDAVWMTACQVFTAVTEGRASGGWPLHVFLEPATLRPFFAGTYFPPAPAHGRIGFPQLLRRIADAWRRSRGDVEEQARELSALIERELAHEAQRRPLDAALEGAAVRSLLSMHDAAHGGFGEAPKFPQPSLALLLQACGGAAAEPALRRTLEGMALGGVRDQLDGGFHRYAVDAAWRVPHFEKMLYDQGQLLPLYARAAATDGLFARVARELAGFLIDGMQTRGGGFRAAIDAEVDGREGLNYLWSRGEAEDALRAAGLAADAALVVAAFGLDGEPNFRDPHHPQDEPRFVLALRGRPESLAARLGMDAAAWTARYDAARRALREARSHRPPPRMDDTIIASWNGLAIAGLADAGRAMGEPRWVEAAARAAADVLAQLGEAGGELRRSAKDGCASGPGFLEDDACVAAGLVALARATGEGHWRERAVALVAAARDRFWHSDLGWIEAPADALGRIAPIASLEDGAMPSGAGVMAECLIDLAQLTGEARWADLAWDGLDRASGSIARTPITAPRSLIAAHRLRERRPDRVPGGAAPSPVRMTLVPVNQAFDRFELRMDMDPGHHVAAHDAAPASGDAAARARAAPKLRGLDIGAVDGGVKLRCRYPNATVRADGSRVYEGRAAVDVEVLEPRPTPRPLRLRVRLQVCGDSHCLAPEERRLEA